MSAKTVNNLVRQTVTELNQLQDDSEEIRAQLLAKGVQTQTINVLVEKGFHDQLDDGDELVDSAVEASLQSYGHGAISRDELFEQLTQLVDIEKDTAYRRRLAKQEGLDIQAMNFLARVIRENPGDGGQRVINSFIGYAKACDVELSGIGEIVQKVSAKPQSVLPDIERPAPAQQQVNAIVVRDVLIGLLFTVVLMSIMI
ncbi:MAG: hypothetical protein AB8B63_00065 [Granulosicoccus sp.]